ncbi:MAG TPA: hypothetical protein PLL00_08990 [Bacteroidia bacterium]|nr:hypothetical protein [Bacteroidia bacterium]
MQAYLVGNGNYTFPCVAFILFGVFYPEVWKELPKEFKRGRISKSIYHLTIDDCMNMHLADIKKEYGRNKPENALNP